MVNRGQKISPHSGASGQFLRLCLRGRRDPQALEAARALATHADLDWETFCDVAQAEGVAPLLYRTARDQDLLPPSTEQRLRRTYDETVVRNTLLFYELESALAKLALAGVPVILLKGAALSRTVYGEAAVRPIRDLDLLVREDDAPAALRVLAALGYEPTRVETRANAVATFKNEVLLFKSGPIRVPLELHWSLFDSPHHQQRLPIDWFWRTAVPIRSGGISALVLGPEAQILHLCGHMVLHHGAGNLLWLFDVAEVITTFGAEIDWQEVLAQAQACDLVLPVQRVLMRVSDELAAPIPPTVLERLQAVRASAAEVRVFALLTSEHRSVAQRFWAKLATLSTCRRRLTYAWGQLFPSPGYMRQRYRITHTLLVPLYYPYRWFRGLRSAVER